MLIHYLKITLRGLYNDRAFAFINVVGLGVAIACCFLLIFWIKFEASFEDCYANKNRIYKLIIEEERKDGLHYTGWMGNITKELKNTFPQIEAATKRTVEQQALKKEGTEGDGIMTYYVQSNADYIRLFDFEYLEGSPETAIQNGCIISKDAALKFFGSESAMDKNFVRYHNDGYKIGAVVDIPTNTQLTFDLLDLKPAFGDNGEIYIMLREGEIMTPQLREQIEKFLPQEGDTKKRLLVQALDDIHLHSPLQIATAERWGYRGNYGNYTQLVYFSVAVFLILLMAIINYVNTSIARAMTRMKEVGVRKVTGAKKRELVERFLFDALVLTFIGVLLAFATTQYTFPIFSELMGHRVAMQYDWQTIAITILVGILIATLSGAYAAFYLSSFKPAIILRGGVQGSSKDRLRSSLLGVQFFLSIAILICTVFIYKQINAIFSESSGMNRENIIVVNTGLWYQAEDYIQIIKRENPNIIDASMSNCPPYNAPWSHTNVSWEGMKSQPGDLSFTQIFCDHNYAKTFGLELIQGEFIPPGLTWWQWTEDKSFNIVVNETFAKQMGVDNVIGMSVKYREGTGKILGVVKDFNYKPLKEKSAPLFLSFNPEAQMFLYIKTTGKDKQATLDYILSKYKEMKPDWNNRPVMYHTVEDEYNKMYESELRTASMLSVFSIISLLLSIMGVVSMVSFMIEKRTKEIAIRKINGAKMPDIILLFWKDLLKIGALGSTIAIPIAYLLMHSWLEGYVYRTALSWWIFLAIPILIMLLVCTIVGIQILYTASQRPADSLRSE